MGIYGTKVIVRDYGGINGDDKYLQDQEGR